MDDTAEDFWRTTTSSFIGERVSVTPKRRDFALSTEKKNGDELPFVSFLLFLSFFCPLHFLHFTPL
jgi:hypothetical protein